MNSFNSYLLLFVFSVFISSVAQILLKNSTKTEYKKKYMEYLNFQVIFAYFLFSISLVLTTFAYKKIPLSLGPIIETLGIIFVTILGSVFLKERVNSRQLFGISIIILGVAITVLF